MKITRFFLAILTLFTASCNPDEDLNDGSNNSGSGNGGGSGNTNNMSFDQAIETIQGVWYLYKIEDWRNGYCVGESQFRSSNDYMDLNFDRWRLEFTDVSASSSGALVTNEFIGIYPDSTSEIHTCYGQNNNNPKYYCFFRGLVDPTKPFFTSNNGEELRLFLGYNDVLGGFFSDSEGYRVNSLSNEALELQCYNAFNFLATPDQRKLFFKRNNVSETPSFANNIVGTYTLTDYKSFENSVQTIDASTISNGLIFQFTDTITSITDSQTRSFLARSIGELVFNYTISGDFNNYSNNTFEYLPIDNNFASLTGDAFFYTTNANEILLTNGGAIKILSITSNQMTIRVHTLNGLSYQCSTYEEFTFARTP